MEEQELKPCPLCNGKRVELLEDYSRIERRKFYSIYCSDCQFTFIPQSTWDMEEIINRWNSRSNDESNNQ